MAIEQKQIKTLRFQDEEMEGETVYALRGSHVGLQGGF